MLRYLVGRHGRLVSKNELLDGVWGRTVVTEGSITQCLIDVRRAIGDESQQMIRTVPRRGYIFEAPDLCIALLFDAPERRVEAEAALERLSAQAGDAMHGLRVAELHVLRGSTDQAFAWLQRAMDGLERDRHLLGRIWYLRQEMHYSPFLRPLYSDPRWARPRDNDDELWMRRPRSSHRSTLLVSLLQKYGVDCTNFPAPLGR